eukprot:scaffold873_cov393-Prasinococcus_capsulatus_cf.AAC.15
MTCPRSAPARRIEAVHRCSSVRARLHAAHAQALAQGGANSRARTCSGTSPAAAADLAAGPSTHGPR